MLLQHTYTHTAHFIIVQGNDAITYGSRCVRWENVDTALEEKLNEWLIVWRFIYLMNKTRKYDVHVLLLMVCWVWPLTQNWPFHWPTSVLQLHRSPFLFIIVNVAVFGWLRDFGVIAWRRSIHFWLKYSIEYTPNTQHISTQILWTNLNK